MKGEDNDLPVKGSAAAADRERTRERTDFDPQLIAAYIAGDREAFRALFEIIRRPLSAVVMRFFSSPFDQEEALQEVLLQLYRARDRFDVNRAQSFGAWARQLARNRCIDLVKARRRNQEVPMDGVEPAAEGRQMSAVADGRVRALLSQFVGGLDGEQRRFFTLCFVEERSHEEIASSLEITVRRSKYLKKKLLARLLKSAPLQQARRNG